MTAGGVNRPVRFRVPPALAERIRHLHPRLRRKVRAGFDRIQSDPLAGKPLKEELTGLRSLRLGRFRMVYRIAGPDEIQIVAVGPRAVIYQETYRLIRREAPPGPTV
ncbi:MAG: type II toxin-antitoxin system RelE/ParE family toxin [Desulfobacteraceae bacterium]|jgi:mRNA interferase RelE/StbE|nr:type II toxin-antitoxin system RelE/ParE family toxin [Desulfobacteraceae bacterium]